MAYQLGIPHGAFHTVTAPEHCAWPNLTLLPNGEIAAVIFNQPSHGAMEGDVELWVSEDEGYTWGMRSRITDHEPGTNRMNVAAGLNQKGELLVLCFGYDLATDFGGAQHSHASWLAPQICISSDNGHTWDIAGEMPAPAGLDKCVPFGDIVINGDELAASVYTRDPTRERRKKYPSSAWLMRSSDGGRTWGDASLVAAHRFGEGAPLITRQGTWLAALRLKQFPADYEPEDVMNRERFVSGPNVLLFASDDAGRTWEPRQYLSLPQQHPAHLLQLADDRILVTYGNRICEAYGVVGRVSADGAQSWSRPFTLVGGLMDYDCGYPASVQVSNGDIVTAYYSKCSPWYQRYHMGVLRWNLDMVDTRALGA